ncbi:hypothetical protein HOP50_10g61180 [Chloropicon primus]|nr:hypothetical protein HOP50_10g61180 [Chloropicon primus]
MFPLAGSTSTLLFRELLAKLQIGTMQDKIFSLRGLNSIVQVNEHTSIRLLKTKDFAKIIFQLCKQKESQPLRIQALKFLRHLASGSVCRKLLLSNGALEDLVDWVIEDFASHSEEFLVVAAEYLMTLLSYDSDLSGYSLTDREKEKLERTLSFLKDSSHVLVRRTMDRMDGGDKHPSLWYLTTSESPGYDRAGPSPGSSLEPKAEHHDRVAEGGEGSRDDIAFNERLRNLKTTLKAKDKDKDKDKEWVSTPASPLAKTDSEGDLGDKERLVTTLGGGEAEASDDSMASISSDTSSTCSSEEEAESRGVGSEDQDEKDVQVVDSAPASEGSEGDLATETEENEVREEVGSDVVQHDVGYGGNTALEVSSSSSEEDVEEESDGRANTGESSGRSEVFLKRGAMLYKFFSSWMQVAEKEMLVRQKIKTLRRLFNQNNRARRVSESFYAWKFNTRQKILLALCLNKWVGLRVANVFVSWLLLARESRRNQRLSERYNRRRLRRLAASSFAEWRSQVNAKVFLSHRDTRARCLFLEDEVDELKEARAEATRFKDHLYNVLSEVAEIGVNLLKVENGGEALIHCCAKVENILRLNSAYVPEEALDTVMASVDWSSLSPRAAAKAGEDLGVNAS